MEIVKDIVFYSVIIIIVVLFFDLKGLKKIVTKCLFFLTIKHFKGYRGNIAYEWIKSTEIDSNLIPIYPRLTIFERVNEKQPYGELKLIFDSSDIEVINDLFEFSKRNGETIKIGQLIKVVDFYTTFWDLKNYTVMDLKVDFLSEFMDYTNDVPFGGGTTRRYRGRKIPYNVQITIQVE